MHFMHSPQLMRQSFHRWLSLPQLQTLVVDVGDIAAGYKIPGQFVQIKVGK